MLTPSDGARNSAAMSKGDSTSAKEISRSIWKSRITSLEQWLGGGLRSERMQQPHRQVGQLYRKLLEHFNNQDTTTLIRSNCLRSELPARGLDGFLERIILWIGSDTRYIAGSRL
jgi:hypothetical protein